MKYLQPLFVLFLLTVSLSVQAQDTVVTASVQGYVFKPAHVKPTDARVQQLTVPQGFTIQKFAEGLGKPRMLVVHDDSTVYVTRRAGDVLMLRDTNGDGKADVTKTVWKKDQVHGIALKDNQMYLVTVNEVFRADIKPDGTIKEPKQIMKDLPDGGQHPNRTIEFGPDGKLYVSVGSTCNA
ncbi:MAG: sorbosone dehydrogenase family protein, partial [Tunicatimonas sp.]